MSAHHQVQNHPMIQQTNQLLIEPPTQQTVAVWCDGDNIFGTDVEKQALTLPGDIKRLLERVQREGRVHLFRVFCNFGNLSNCGVDARSCFEEAGIECPLSIDTCGKNNADIAIATDIVETLWQCPEIDTVILCSGDGGFEYVIRAAHRKQKNVVLMAHQGSLSRKLSDEADRVVLLTKTGANKRNKRKTRDHKYNYRTKKYHLQ